MKISALVRGCLEAAGTIQAPDTPTLVNCLLPKSSFGDHLAGWHRIAHVHTAGFSCSPKGDCVQISYREQFLPSARS